jgi:hypothetical protein
MENKTAANLIKFRFLLRQILEKQNKSKKINEREVQTLLNEICRVLEEIKKRNSKFNLWIDSFFSQKETFDKAFQAYKKFKSLSLIKKGENLEQGVTVVDFTHQARLAWLGFTYFKNKKYQTKRNYEYAKLFFEKIFGPEKELQNLLGIEIKEYLSWFLILGEEESLPNQLRDRLLKKSKKEMEFLSVPNYEPFFVKKMEFLITLLVNLENEIDHSIETGNLSETEIKKQLSKNFIPKNFGIKPLSEKNWFLRKDSLQKKK